MGFGAAFLRDFRGEGRRNARLIYSVQQVAVGNAGTRFVLLTRFRSELRIM